MLTDKYHENFQKSDCAEKTKEFFLQTRKTNFAFCKDEKPMSEKTILRKLQNIEKAHRVNTFN